VHRLAHKQERHMVRRKEQHMGPERHTVQRMEQELVHSALVQQKRLGQQT